MCLSSNLHLRLELLEVGLQLLHVGLLRGPADAEALLLVGLGDLVRVSLSLAETLDLSRWTPERPSRIINKIKRGAGGIASSLPGFLTYHVEMDLMR